MAGRAPTWRGSARYEQMTPEERQREIERVREANRIHCKETRDRKREKERLLREVTIPIPTLVHILTTLKQNKSALDVWSKSAHKLVLICLPVCFHSSDFLPFLLDVRYVEIEM